MPIRARADRSLVRAGKRSLRVARVEVTVSEAETGSPGKDAEPEREGDSRGAEPAVVNEEEELRPDADGDRPAEAIADRLGPEIAMLSRKTDPFAKLLINAGAFYEHDGRAVRGVTVMKSPLRTMTMAREDLIAALEVAAAAYRAAPARAFGGFPDLFAEWPLPEPRNPRELLTDFDELLVAREARAHWKPDRIPVTVVFTSRPLSDALPWHWHRDWCVAIASTAGLCTPGGVSPAAFAAHQTFLQGLRERGIAPEEMTHVERRVCLYDRCTRREDLESALCAATFCDECRRALERAGLFPEPALSIAGAIFSLVGAAAGGVN